MAVSGADGSVEVPFTRWELEEVWDKNPDAPGKMLGWVVGLLKRPFYKQPPGTG